jgi:DNA-directed RNA polymerase subunit RPC12/RpoP
VRITPLRGPGAALLKCPACRLKCRPTAIGPDGACPSCGHERLLRVDVLRGRIAPAGRPGGASGESGEQVGP